MELNFAKNNEDGTVQVQKALEALLPGNLPGDLAFMAIAVEPFKKSKFPPALDSFAARNQRILQAVQALQNHQPPIRPVIYTSKDNWLLITGNSSLFSLMGVPLWDVFAPNVGGDVIPDLGQNCILPDFTNIVVCDPFAPGYGGWISRVGQQYKIDTTLFATDVDFDIFDPSLFP